MNLERDDVLAMMDIAKMYAHHLGATDNPIAAAVLVLATVMRTGPQDLEDEDEGY